MVKSLVVAVAVACAAALYGCSTGRSATRVATPPPVAGQAAGGSSATSTSLQSSASDTRVADPARPPVPNVGVYDPPPSTTSPVPFGPAAAPTPPDLVNTGTDWPSIVRSLRVYLDWIGEHPGSAPSYLANVVSPLSAMTTQYLQEYGQMASAGQHYADQPPALLDVQFEGNLDTQHVQLEVVTSSNLDRVEDSAGNVVRSDNGWHVRKEYWVLVQPASTGNAGPWTISAFHIEGPPTSATPSAPR